MICFAQKQTREAIIGVTPSPRGNWFSNLKGRVSMCTVLDGLGSRVPANVMPSVQDSSIASTLSWFLIVVHFRHIICLDILHVNSYFGYQSGSEWWCDYWVAENWTREGTRDTAYFNTCITDGPHPLVPSITQHQALLHVLLCWHREKYGTKLKVNAISDFPNIMTSFFVLYP